MESYQEQVLAFLKGEMSAEEKRAFEESLARSTELRAELERSRELLELLEAANEQAVAHRVEEQIQQSIKRGASDIHVVPGTQETVVSVRIDGLLKELERISKEQTQALVDRWKVLAGCSITERHLPQDGRILVTQDDKDFDLRVSILPTVLGERVTVRVLFKSVDIVALDRLGLSESQLAAARRLLNRPSGFVAAVGPMGSGKTTTVYGMLLELTGRKDTGANVMSVEEPVEFALNGVSQIRVNRRIGFTHAAALRAVMRSDPDVIMVGDVPDRETAELALQASSTGHLVLAPVTVNHAAGSHLLGAIQRLRDLGIDSFLIAQNLVGGVGQRLLRRVCTECQAEYQPEPAGLQRLGLGATDGPFRRGSGCAACRSTGYRRRLALYEVLEVDNDLRGRIAAGATVEELAPLVVGRPNGSLWEDARQKVRQGLTTVEEALRVLFDYPPSPGAASVD
jgi:type II secretory ATPase GspE/PulE/Tfp pilus assembly ATPase PilB-like protein